MSDNVARALNLVWQALDAMLFRWKIDVALVVLVALAVVASHPFRGGFRRRHAVLVLPFIVPFATVLWAAAFAHEAGGDIRRVPAWQIDGVITIAILVLPVSAIVIYRSKGYRWFAASVSVLAIWVSYWFYIVGVMSVTGVWV